MKQIKRFIKNNIKLLIGIIAGLIISGTCVYASILYQGSDVSFDNTNANLTLNNQPVDNIQDALVALKEKVDNASVGTLKLGDYFTLVPDVATFTVRTRATGYTSDQTINIAGTSDSNGLRLWRVIDIYQDGSVDAVSEYVSYNAVYFQGAIGYQNCVSTLQLIASQYAKAGYTIGTRMMGYGGQTPVIQTKSSTCDDTTCQTTTTYAFDGSTNNAPTTTSTPARNSGTAPYPTGPGQEYSGGVGGDTLYLKDLYLVSNIYKSESTTYGDMGIKAYKVGTTTATNYYLASRLYSYSSSPDYRFSVQMVWNSGSMTGSAAMLVSYMGYWNSNVNQWQVTWNNSRANASFRPIITLKSGITTSGGSGTKTSPYTLS